MYGWSMVEEGFYKKVDKFIEATEKHASMLIYNKDTIIYFCKDCKNLMSFTDMNTIKSHLIMRGFVPDYTVWIHHGETMDVDNGYNEQEHDVKTLKYLYQCSNEVDEEMMGCDFGDEQGDDDAGGAKNGGGACEGDKDDGDNFEDMLRAFRPENITIEEWSRKSREAEKSVEGDYVWC